MRAWKLFAVCLSAALFTTPAAARFGFCMAVIPGKDHQGIPGHYNTTYPSYVSAAIDFGGSSERVAEQFAKQFAEAVGTAHARCYNHLEDASAATYYRIETLKKGLSQHVESAWTGGSPAAANARAERKPDTDVGGIQITGPETTPAKRAAPPARKYVEVAGPDGKSIRLSPEVAERNKAAADEYRRKREEHARATAEHDQRLAQHRQNAATAASAEEQHKREVAAAAERYAAYQAAMADHARKVAGASTNDDPNTCITRPEFRSNDGLPGNTSASVINGCPQKVDIVLCLKRIAGDWTCGAKFGILPQGKMSYATRNATGEIFVDAITYGGGGKLKRPAGM